MTARASVPSGSSPRVTASVTQLDHSAIALDGNVYRRSDSSTPRSLIVWTDRAGVTSQFPDLARFRSATGQEKHGRLDNT